MNTKHLIIASLATLSLMACSKNAGSEASSQSQPADTEASATADTTSTGGATAAQVPDQVDYVEYVNAVKGFSAEYPSFIEAKEAPGNAQGRIFSNGEFTQKVYAEPNPLELTIAERFKQAVKSIDKIQEQTDDHFVVSGEEFDNVYYRKTYLRDNTFFTIEVEYPVAKASTYKPLCDHVVESFKVN